MKRQRDAVETGGDNAGGVPAEYHDKIKEQYRRLRYRVMGRGDCLEELLDDWGIVERGWAKNKDEAIGLLKTLVG